MTYAIGSAARLTTTIRDVGGNLVTPASVQVTIQLPDGTSDGPFTPTSSSTGVYYYDYTPATAGRHIARWVSAGPAGADEEPFEVAQQWSAAGIISLAAGKKQLNIDAGNTDDDTEIVGYIRSITGPIERIVGSVVRRSWTERHEGGWAVVLHQRPVLTLTSVAAARTGVAVPSVADLDLDENSGVVRRIDGGWICGPLRVTYLAGRSEVQADAAQAAALILQHLWETQRGTQGTVRRGGSDEVWDPRFGYSIPRRAQELLGTPTPGVG